MHTNTTNHDPDKRILLFMFLTITTFGTVILVQMWFDINIPFMVIVCITSIITTVLHE